MTNITTMTRSTDDQITLLRCLVCGPILGDLSVQIFLCTSIRMSHSDDMHFTSSSDSTFYTMGDITEFWVFFLDHSQSTTGNELTPIRLF